MLTNFQAGVRFTGEAERKAYYDKYSQLPQESKQRLYDIFLLRDMEAHKKLAKELGEVDPNVDAVNKEIGRLARSRDGETDATKKATLQEMLNDLRAAIGRVMAEFKKATGQ